MFLAHRDKWAFVILCLTVQKCTSDVCMNIISFGSTSDVVWALYLLAVPLMLCEHYTLWLYLWSLYKHYTFDTCSTSDVCMRTIPFDSTADECMSIISFDSTSAVLCEHYSVWQYLWCCVSIIPIDSTTDICESIIPFDSTYDINLSMIPFNSTSDVVWALYPLTVPMIFKHHTLL